MEESFEIFHDCPVKIKDDEDQGFLPTFLMTGLQRLPDSLLDPVQAAKLNLGKLNSDSYDKRFTYIGIWLAVILPLMIDCFFFHAGILMFFTFHFYPNIVLYSLELAVILYGSLKVAEMGHGLFKAIYERLSIPEEPRPTEPPRLNFSHYSPRKDEPMRGSPLISANEFGDRSFMNSSNIMAQTPSPTSEFQRDSSLFRALTNGQGFIVEDLDSTSSSFISPLCRSDKHSIRDPIHTKAQLNALLYEDNEDLSYATSISPGRLAMLRRLELSPSSQDYQLSLDSQESDGRSEKFLKISDDGRVNLMPSDEEIRGENGEQLDFRVFANESRDTWNARRSSVTGRLRRSVSPEHGPSGDLSSSFGTAANTSGGGLFEEFSTQDYEANLLTDDEMYRCEPRLRIWIVRTILQPIIKAIKETNQELTKNFSGLHLRVGLSTLEALRLALKTNPRLSTTKLPFLLPFLETDENQQYLIARITELASDPFMDAFAWNRGGTVPKEEEGQKENRRFLAQPWQPTLPTDTQLVFKLFATYLDSMLSSSAFTNCRLNRPFTSRYVLEKEKMAPYQMPPFDYFFRWSSFYPPKLDFIMLGETGRPFALPNTPGHHNLFKSILGFINYVKVYHDGAINQVEMGPAGINLLCVLDSD